MGVKITSNIIFLGTGGDSYVVGKQIRASGGIIIQIDEDQYHIDPGPGSLVMAKEADINIRANTAIFITHNHINHCNDLNAVIDAMTYGGFDKKGVLISSNTVINGTPNHQPFLQKYYRDCLERFIVLNTGNKVGINNVEVKAITAKHSDPNAIGFKFMTPDYTLTYSGDTSYSAEVVHDYEGSNVLILNVPCIKKEESRNNLCMDDAIKIIKKVNPRLAIITHFGINFLKSDPLYMIREIQKQTDCQVIAAKDGMVINPLSYSVEQGQKSLYKYSKKQGVTLHEFKVPAPEIKEVEEMYEEKQTMLEDEVPETEVQNDEAIQEPEEKKEEFNQESENQYDEKDQNSEIDKPNEEVTQDQEAEIEQDKESQNPELKKQEDDIDSNEQDKELARDSEDQNDKLDKESEEQKGNITQKTPYS